MPESRRFDPLGWFISACFTILAGAIALSVAISLIRSVWTWLLLGTGIIVAIGLAVRLLVWRHRRQLW